MNLFARFALLSSPPRSPQWPAVRAQHLAEEPVCVACGRMVNLNVHHIKPFHIWPELELVDSNLITLCEGLLRGRHHLQFGHLGSWRNSNPRVRADAEAYYTKTHEVI